MCRDRSSAPFRCLDSGYRRELLRVYASNVDSICVRFVEERRAQLQVTVRLHAALADVSSRSQVTLAPPVCHKELPLLP